MIKQFFLQTLVVLTSNFVIFVVQAVIEKLIRDYVKDNNNKKR